MLSPYDISKLVGNKDAFAFGFVAKKVADEFRKLADGIESGDINLQKIYTTQLGKYDDFAITRVILTFHERQKRDDV